MKRFLLLAFAAVANCGDQSMAQAPDAQVPDAAPADAARPDAAPPDAAPQPTELATQLEHPRGLAIDGNEIYFTTNGTRLFDSIDGQVQRIARTGGTREILATGLHGPDVIRVDATHAYWMSMGGSDQTMDPAAIQGVAKQGGTVQTLAQSQTFGRHRFEMSGDYLYWLSDRLWRVPKAGGAPEDYGFQTGIALAAGSNYMFVLDSQYLSAVDSQGISMSLEYLQRAEGALAASGDTVFFVGGLQAGADERLGRATAGAGAPTYGPTVTGPVTSIALDDRYVWYSDNGVIRRAEKGALGAIDITACSPCDGIAVDDAFIYFLVEGTGVNGDLDQGYNHDGKLMRLAKEAM